MDTCIPVLLLLRQATSRLLSLVLLEHNIFSETEVAARRRWDRTEVEGDPSGVMTFTTILIFAIWPPFVEAGLSVSRDVD